MKQVIDQATRRVIQGETVPAREKVVSFFESHTDIIVKGQRETEYGHKIFLTGGTSNLILDCIIERGNPSDADHYRQLVERIENIYGRVPRQVTADGGFASKENLAWAKGKEIKDVAFSKKRGLSVLDMVKSSWVYKKLKNFRAGIEANISALKRAFGLSAVAGADWKDSNSTYGVQ
jgi:IS5 family transposase